MEMTALGSAVGKSQNWKNERNNTSAAGHISLKPQIIEDLLIETLMSSQSELYCQSNHTTSIAPLNCVAPHSIVLVLTESV